jgi:hypothetical protein
MSSLRGRRSSGRLGPRRHMRFTRQLASTAASPGTTSRVRSIGSPFTQVPLLDPKSRKDQPPPEATGDPLRGKIGCKASELLDLLCARHLLETPLEGVETQIALAAPPSQEVCGMFSRLFRRPHTCILQDRITRVQRGNLPRAWGAGGVTGACPVCARMLT